MELPLRNKLVDVLRKKHVLRGRYNSRKAENLSVARIMMHVCPRDHSGVARLSCEPRYSFLYIIWNPEHGERREWAASKTPVCLHLHRQPWDFRAAEVFRGGCDLYSRFLNGDRDRGLRGLTFRWMKLKLRYNTGERYRPLPSTNTCTNVYLSAR